MKQKDAELKRKQTGADGFESFYASFFGTRWQPLKKALAQEALYVRLDFSREGEETQPYFIDAASVAAALCLPVCRLDGNGNGGLAKVLDLCAAPGGKSLVLAGGLGGDGQLFSNELSPDRKARLDKVLSDSLPASLRNRGTTSCSDGATWCRRETESFSAILLDAPCSSERHVLADDKYLSQWSASRIKSLVSRQWALLSSAWRLLVPGGFLLYATCALAPDENDGVASRLLKKFPDVCSIRKADELSGIFEERLASFSGAILAPDGGSAEGLVRQVFRGAEETELGRQVLPDSGGGAGPLYFALFRKDGAK